jgi:hypothetical protein
MIVVKTVVRTLLYQFLFLFAGLSIGFIAHANYWGNRAPIIERSVQHIFFPIEYNKYVEDFIIDTGRKRLFFETIYEFNNQLPELFEIVKGSEYIEGEEWYCCEYQYVDEDGNLDVYEYRTRIKWKPWELYYPSADDEKKIQEELDNMTIEK